MEKVKILLEKDLRTRISSKESKVLVMNAPKAISGLGKFFSPTDFCWQLV